MLFDFIQSPVWNTIFIFATLAIILYYWKPEPLFNNETGEMRAFGFGNGKTCFTFAIVTFSVAMIAYFILTLLHSLSFS